MAVPAGQPASTQQPSPRCMVSSRPFVSPQGTRCADVLGRHSPPNRWAPALCQPCPRMETRGQWALPLPSRGSSLVGGTVRCFTHKNSTQHLLTPPWCARHCRYSLTFSC